MCYIPVVLIMCFLIIYSKTLHFMQVIFTVLQLLGLLLFSLKYNQYFYYFLIKGHYSQVYFFKNQFFSHFFLYSGIGLTHLHTLKTLLMFWWFTSPIVLMLAVSFGLIIFVKLLTSEDNYSFFSIPIKFSVHYIFTVQQTKNLLSL